MPWNRLGVANPEGSFLAIADRENSIFLICVLRLPPRDKPRWPIFPWHH